MTRRALLWRLAWLGGAGFAASCLQACGGQPAGYGAALAPAGASTSAAVSGASATPKRGGVLISGVTAEPPTLDPHLGFPQTWSSLLYDDLVYFDRDNKPQPAVSEAWEVLDGGASLLFHLRKGVLFHNGREMVADDVKYSMERLQQKASVFSSDYAAIKSVDVPDRYTVRLNFGRPFPGAFRMLAQFKGGEIVAREAVEANGDLARTAMGTGPFMLDHWAPGSEIVLKRNPRYWRQGLPYLDGITFKVIPDEAGIVAGLRAGSVHHLQILDFTNAKALESDPNVRVYRTPRVQDGVTAMYVNARIGALKDPKVREALYWAFDREAAVKIATAGLGVATGPISPTVTEWALPDDEVKVWWKRDLPRAKKAADDARASGKHPDGIRTEVWADAATRWRVDTAQILSANAKEVGIQCDVVMMEPGIISKRFLAREAPIYPNTWGASAIDPDAMYRFLHSKGQDYPYLNDPEVDQLLDQGRYTWDSKVRKQVYDKLQRIMLERYANIWMYHIDAYDAARRNVHFTRDLYPPMGLRGLEQTWIE